MGQDVSGGKEEVKHAELRSEDDLTRETMHIACIYGWLSRGWDQQRYGCKIDKSPFPDSGDLIVDQMEASKIVWAMGDQPKPINHWLFYAYGDQESPDWAWHARQAAYVLWQRFPKPDNTNYNIGWMALQDFRRRVMGQPAFADELLMAGMGGKKWAWEKHWRPKFEENLDQLQAWDVYGVGMVSKTVKEIREGRA
jgi:hypothetical protein